jgi:hypothetical protein
VDAMSNRKPFKPMVENARFHSLTVSELRYVAQDAKAAAESLKGEACEGKYLDQVNDACSVLYYRANLQDYAEQARR